MARTFAEGKCDDSKPERSKGGEEEEEEEDEEEALSLCDLPVKLMKEGSNSRNEESPAAKTEEDFDFGSWDGSLSTEPTEMCSADEVFFKGQILPLRHSVSSESGLSGFHRNLSLSMSRSESMDHGSVGPFKNASSRSSSCRSHYSSSSTASSSSTNITRNKPRIRNHFITTHPSPKPQIRISSARQGSFNSRKQKSSMWEFLRLGLVRAPEIELQDLKVRSRNNSSVNRGSVSRNSSCSSSNSSSSVKNTTKPNSPKNQQEFSTEKKKKQSFLEKRRMLFTGCKCSVNVVETVPLNNIIVIKSVNDGSKKNNESKSVRAMEEKLQELKIQKKSKEKQQGKQALSRHRTFEWLKELSHAGYADHEA